MEENNTILEDNSTEQILEDSPKDIESEQQESTMTEEAAETVQLEQQEDVNPPEQTQDDKAEAESVEQQGQQEDPEPVSVDLLDEDEDEDEEEEEESFADLKGDWYILQVYTGYENRVKISIEQRIVDLGLQDKVFKVLIPMEDTVEIKNNKRVETRKKMYPGYVFINMILEDDVWYSVRKIPGIARFVGGESRPEPVQEGEMLRVLKQVGAKVKKIEIDFEIGETVRVVAGPFRGYTGVIKEINADRGKVKVLMSIFGRETPMELEFDQLEKNS